MVYARRYRRGNLGEAFARGVVSRGRSITALAVFGAGLVAGSATGLAGQLPASAFQAYNPANAASILPGPFALYTVNVNTLHATQLNVGFTEVDHKAAGFNILTSASALSADLLTDIEPVVIGPGGVLYQTDGHHTFLALIDSAWGSTNPTVDVNVIANYSNLTTQQFFAMLEQQNLVYPVNDGVLETVNFNTGAPLPSSLPGMTSDVYRRSAAYRPGSPAAAPSRSGRRRECSRRCGAARQAGNRKAG
jgi:fibronectin-binding autotransporter adhesin